MKQIDRQHLLILTYVYIYIYIHTCAPTTHRTPCPGVPETSQNLPPPSEAAPAEPPRAVSAEPEISEGAIYKRLDRLINQPKKGKFRVSDDIREQWQDIAFGRKKLLTLFAECKHDPDCLDQTHVAVTKKVLHSMWG